MSSKILVIDDHKETLELITLVLQKQGFRVKNAHSGQEGLAIANQFIPDLILLDVMMPDMDGFTVCRTVRQTETISETPIILLTAKSQPNEKWEGFEAGATDYLIKPTNAEELNRRVSAILSNKKKNESPAKPAGGGATVMTMSPFARSQMTVFLGACGGCGTTTTAINTAFAHAINEQTLLADLDMVQGHVAMYLNQKISGSINSLAEGIPMNVGGQLSNNVTRVSPNLSVLLAKPNFDSQMAVMGEKHLPNLVEAMHSRGESTIIDGGSGIHDGNRSVIERADQIVLCVRPDRVSLASARELVPAINATMLPTCLLHIVIVSIGPSAKLPKDKIEGYLGANITATLQIPLATLAKSANNGRPIILTEPDGETTKQFRSLAETVAKL